MRSQWNLLCRSLVSDQIVIPTGIQMLTMLVPILITYLLDPTALKTAKRQAMQLHENSLQWLKKIGPKYPEVS